MDKTNKLFNYERKISYNKKYIFILLILIILTTISIICLYNYIDEQFLKRGQIYFIKIINKIMYTICDKTNNSSVLLNMSFQKLSRDYQKFINDTTLSFLILSVIFIYFFSFVVFISTIIFIISKNDKKIMKQQKENNRILAQKAEIADKANIAKSRFLSHMSHDIRTPINGIIGMTNIALINVDNSQKVRDCLEKIDTASEHLLSLINDILDMSRIENGKVTINNKPLNINNFLNKCTSIIEGGLQNRDIMFITEFDSFKYPYFIGDEMHLLQILINILGNAVKFTPDGGEIRFTVKENKVCKNTIKYCFEIEDTGIGMKEEYLEHIWDAFSQENNPSRYEYSGTGLGMSITKQLVALLKGDISVESQENIGSKFTVNLPFEIAKESTLCSTNNIDIELKGLKILLVEDNELNMEIVKDILKNYDVTITEAENGKIAVDIFSNSEINYFDLILMDVMMPVMDGLTATKTIRNIKRADASNIPIIAMTANAYYEDIIKTFEAGMNAHLSKPIEINKFLNTISHFKQKNKV